MLETWRDNRDAMRLFSVAARAFLVAELLSWTGFGINQVAFNLYLVEAGYSEAMVGGAVSFNALGLALAALPAGLLADRWGRRRALVLGAIVEAVALASRASVSGPGWIYGAGFLAGVGQALIVVTAAPFITDHSTPRERTHLFSAYFAVSLLAGVLGSLIGGWLPAGLEHLPGAITVERLHAYRITLWVSAVLALAAAAPLLAIRSYREGTPEPSPADAIPNAGRRLVPIAINAFLIGAGAGLVIPFMNLYFRSRFDCSSAQIGVFFSIAQVVTAFAAMIGPTVARRFGKLRTATAAELLSLPFLVTLGAEQRLEVAVAAFWLRATLMQASTPLVTAFIMESLPPALRARCSSLNSMVWNLGWAASATLSGFIIQRFGYAMPFYLTAGLYAFAALFFFFSFRDVAESGRAPRAGDQVRGARGEGPVSE